MSACSEFNFLRIIGTSTFSSTTVYLAQHKKLSVPKAIRQTDLEKCSLGDLFHIQNELRISRSLRHKNLLIHENDFVEKQNLYVITEFMSYGACSDLLESYFKYGLPEIFIIYALREISNALIYLHRLGFIHRGVKACHILVSGDGRIKLSGNRNMISMLNNEQRLRNVHDFPKQDLHLLPWLSPEILQQNMEGYDMQSDIYSVGITACELSNGHAPFTDMPSTQMLLEKLNGTKPCLLDQTTVPDGSDVDYCANDEVHSQHEVAKSRIFSDSFHQFVSCCLHREPSSRPTATQLLTHPFFNQNLPLHPNLEVLLHPLVPVNPESHKLSSSVDKGVSDITENLREVSMKENGWDFNEG